MNLIYTKPLLFLKVIIFFEIVKKHNMNNLKTKVILLLLLLLLIFNFINCKDNEKTKKENTKEKSTSVINNKPYKTHGVISNAKKYTVPNGFYIHDSAFVKTNNITYKIIALEKNKNRNNKGDWYFGLPIIVLKIENNNSFELFKNDNIVFKLNDNCPADGYNAIVSKNNYFTIEQSSCLDFMFVNSYTTFKIDAKTNNIYLHKYSEEYSDRSDPDREIPVKTWSTKDFGVVNFEDVTEPFVNKLRNKN
jgi:hypothetical protein